MEGSKLFISTGDLANMLQVLNAIIPANPIIPSLENVLMDVDGESLRLTASDGEIMATIITDAVKEGEDFNVLLPAKLLGELSKGLPLHPITFELDDRLNEVGNEEVLISSQIGTYAIQIPDITEYVSILEAGDDSEAIEAFSHYFIRGIEDIIFACADDELRPVLSGINIYMDSFLIRMAATDGYMLAEKKFILSGKIMPPGNFKDFVISQKAAKCLVKMLKQYSGDTIRVLVTETHAQFYCDMMSFSCKIIDAKYPDYRGVIPETFSSECDIQRLDLFASLKRVALFAEKKKNGVVSLEFKEHDADKMTICASKEDFSLYANETISCFYRGNPMRISFLANKLSAILDNMKHADTVIKLSSPKQAIGIFGKYTDDYEKTTYVLVPVVDFD